MNVTLIPFFLAVNIVVNDQSEWIFGPEFSFKMQITHEVYGDSMHFFDRKRFSTIKCYPKMLDSLFCQLKFNGENDCFEMSSFFIINFEMKFNESGVESILTGSPQNIFMNKLIQKFAKQLSTGIHAHRNFNGNYVMADVDYSIDKTPKTMCQTVYSIEYLEPEVKTTEKKEDFQFEILPMFDLKPDSSFVIQKSNADCYYHWIQTLKDKTAFERKFSTLQIKFERWIEPMKTFENDTYNILLDIFNKETIEVMLADIKPAKNKFPWWKKFAENLMKFC